MTVDNVVIVGGGLAAVHAAETLRSEGFAGSVAIVAREPHPPYERPPLTKSFLTGAKPIDGAFPHDVAWYADQGIDLRTGTAVTAIDRDASTVTLDDGSTLPYDALVLATGAVPRVPGFPGAERGHYVRTIDDSQRLKAAFEQGGRVAIVGGGWIGLEVAAAARGYGLDVTVIEHFPLPLGTILGPTLGQYLRDLHTRNGVDVRTGTDVESITADGVVTAAGLVPADIVVVATGAAPETSLAEAAGLSLASREDGGGVLADERLRTSDPRVYVAGDVANAHNTALGRHLRVEHWDNAIRQGRLAARAILGQDAVYDWQPYFYTDQFDFGMEYVGRGGPDDDVEIRGDLDSGEFIAYWLGGDDGDTVTAGMNVNIWDVNDRLRELVGTRVDRATLTGLR